MDIIFLNGASSAGKSTIVKDLQNLFEDNYLHIGIDKFIGMMPEKTNDWTGETVKDGFYWQQVNLANGEPAYRVTAGVYGKKINDAYRKCTANLAKMGLKIIVDDVINGNEELQLWKKLLTPYKVIYVGVFCNETKLEHREKSRGDRKIGTAIEQHHRTHQNIDYDFKVNTTNMSSLDCAEAIVTKMKSLNKSP